MQYPQVWPQLQIRTHFHCAASHCIPPAGARALACLCNATQLQSRPCLITKHEASNHRSSQLASSKDLLAFYTMDGVDDSELWMSEEEDGGEGDDEEYGTNTEDPTFFQLELGRRGQSGGN